MLGDDPADDTLSLIHICHQANSRIIDHCVRALKADPAKFYKNMAVSYTHLDVYKRQMPGSSNGRPAPDTTASTPASTAVRIAAA